MAKKPSLKDQMKGPARKSPGTIADELKAVVDLAVEPEKMSKAEAVDVLENLRDQIVSSIEALREEMGEEE